MTSKKDGTSRRCLRVLVKDFRRHLYRAPFVLEVITVCVVGFYAYQAWQANRLMRESIEAAGRPILSVRLTDKTLVIGKVPTMNFEADNLGRIPALDVRIEHCAEIAPIPDDNFVIPECQKLPTFPQVIFPGYPEHDQAYGHHPVSQSEDAMIKNKSSAFYRMGLIRYIDPEHVSYFTRFCYRYPSLFSGAIESDAQACPNPGSNDAN